MENISLWNEEIEQQFLHLFQLDSDQKPLRGIECGIGWKKHIIIFLKNLDFHLEKNCYYFHKKHYVKDNKSSIKILQIKEKFGYINCYLEVSSKSDELKKIVVQEIAKLEAKCELTCESCGKIGENFRSNHKNRIVCLCQNCKEK